MAIPRFTSTDIGKAISRLFPTTMSPVNIAFHSSLSLFGVLAEERQTFFRNFLSYLPAQTNLFFPTFSYSYRRNLVFNQSVINPSVFQDMGVLSKMAYESQLGYQSSCPLFSYYIIGPDSFRLSRLSSVDCFGEHSLFSTLFTPNSYLVGLGITYSNGMTPFMYIEKSVGVPFRHDILLSGQRVNQSTYQVETHAVMHYARSEEKYPTLVTNAREGIGRQLEANYISRTQHLNGRKIYALDAPEFFAFVKTSLQSDPFCMCSQ